MVTLFKNSIFWKKFTRFLIFGLSIFIILAAFKVNTNSKVTADYSCPTATGIANITNPSNNQILAFGTSSTTVSWNAAPYAQSYAVTATNRSTGAVIFTNADFSGTSFTLSPLVNGNSYRVLIQPKNNCGLGASSEIAFSVAAATSNCTNQPIFCPDLNDGGGSYVYPDPNNNCIIPACSGGVSGQLTCSITVSPQGGNNYSLAGYPTNLSYEYYNWDLDGNYIFNDALGPNVPSRYFAPNTTVKLRIRDAANNTGVCSAVIASTGSSGTATCTITPQSTTISQGGYVSFYGYYNPNGNNRSASSYNWNFGDGGTYYGGSSNQASHNFSNSNNVTLTINDNYGGTTLCYAYVTVNNPNSCPTDTYTCPNGTSVGRNPNNSCNFYTCPQVNNQCRSINCIAAPAGCYYSGQITTSCDPNVALTCGTLIGNCSNANSPTVIYPNTTYPSGSAVTITNNNSSSSSSSSSNNNNNNITIR